MKRNSYRLVNNRGHKYELERATCTKHQNFNQMYDCIEDALIKLGLSKALNVPIFMDNAVNEVSENDKARLGMKVFTHITHLKICIVADEVGCNICQNVMVILEEPKNM